MGQENEINFARQPRRKQKYRHNIYRLFYCGQRSMLLDYIVSHMNPIHALHAVSLKSVLLLSFHLPMYYPHGFIASSFKTDVAHIFLLFLTCYVPSQIY